MKSFPAIYYLSPSIKELTPDFHGPCSYLAASSSYLGGLGLSMSGFELALTAVDSW